jgi:hypothetical protein
MWFIFQSFLNITQENLPKLEKIGLTNVMLLMMVK